MSTLYIDRKNTLIKLDGEALAFYCKNQRTGSAPLNPFKRVVIVGGDVLIEAKALHKLAEKEISVIFLSGKRLQYRGSLHGRLHNNGLLRVKQYEKSLTDFSITFAHELLGRKIEGQISVLNEAINRRTDLQFSLSKANKILEGIIDSLHKESLNIDSLMGYEGGASNAYFHAFTMLFADSLDFNKRQRRPPTDPVNAMLSLCYTMIHWEIVREIETIGLDPTIGFYHQFEYGRESLACDLVEPYRPSVDRFVWEIFRERIFTSRDFTTGTERPGVYLKKEARQKFYEKYEEWASQMRTQFTEELRNLARRILNGQDTLPF
jgi:CRISPR-associated protein Cas1